MQYHMYRDAQNQWRWRLVAGNNRIIATSGEGYYNESDCLAAINLVKGSSVAQARGAGDEPRATRPGSAAQFPHPAPANASRVRARGRRPDVPQPAERAKSQ